MDEMKRIISMVYRRDFKAMIEYTEEIEERERIQVEQIIQAKKNFEKLCNAEPIGHKECNVIS